MREGVREREMQFHPRLRQAIDGKQFTDEVISFHLLSIKRGGNADIFLQTDAQRHS